MARVDDVRAALLEARAKSEQAIAEVSDGARRAEARAAAAEARVDRQQSLVTSCSESVSSMVHLQRELQSDLASCVQVSVSHRLPIGCLRYMCCMAYILPQDDKVGVRAIVARIDALRTLLSATADRSLSPPPMRIARVMELVAVSAVVRLRKESSRYRSCRGAALVARSKSFRAR